MIPAQQGFHAADFSGGEIDLRLILEHEFVALERAPQVALQAPPFQNSRLHFRPEELTVIAPQFLGFIQGSVRAGDEDFGVCAIARVGTGTDTGVDLK
jgi:hypothetical protein